MSNQKQIKQIHATICKRGKPRNAKHHMARQSRQIRTSAPRGAPKCWMRRGGCSATSSSSSRRKASDLKLSAGVNLLLSQNSWCGDDIFAHPSLQCSLAAEEPCQQACQLFPVGIPHFNYLSHVHLEYICLDRAQDNQQISGFQAWGNEVSV
ncbi:hypothetical protein DL95DRAFT_392215 [Leptodontidium sp. 2 PMI_412]|nr:hypothetical protein DL95DRAFT_392215 [Leptodontidium sp. 2 PMI_412]